MDEYKRITPRDWHDAKFEQLDQRVVLKRLWDLENQIERSSKQYYYVTLGFPKKEFIGGGRVRYTETYEVAMGIPSDAAIYFGTFDKKSDAEARAAELNKTPETFIV